MNIEPRWSEKHQRVLYKLSKQGTSKTLILNADDLRQLTQEASRLLEAHSISD